MKEKALLGRGAFFSHPACALFTQDTHRSLGPTRTIVATDQRPVLLLAKYFLPALVRRPFIAALPIDIFLIGALRKICLLYTSDAADE